MGSPVALILGIATLAGGVWAVVHFIGWLRARNQRPEVPTYTRDALRKRLSILAIDDSGFTYYRDFVGDNYSIDQWNRLDALGDVENFDHDVLILDIKGIAPHISADDGLGVGLHVRKTMESLPIIIYSGATFGLSVDRSWADTVVEVSDADYRRFRDLIDEAFQGLTSPGYYLRHLASSDRSTVTERDRTVLLEEVRTALIDPSLPRGHVTYSSHETAARAADVRNHAVAVSHKLHRSDV